MSISLDAALDERAQAALRRDGVVKSAARVLHILEFFDRRRGPANVHAVSTALGYPVSSTAALLRSLVTMGYLHYDRTLRTFAPTLRVPLLGANWVAPALVGGGGSLQRLMAALATRTDASVALAARNGDAAEYIQVLGSLADRMDVGGQRSLVTDIVGQAVLAGAPDREIRGLLHRWNAVAASRGQANVRPGDVVAELARLRRAGFIAGIMGGFGLVAAPLPVDELGGPYAVVVILDAATFAARQATIGEILREEIAAHLAPPAKPLRWPAHGALRMPEATQRAQAAR